MFHYIYYTSSIFSFNIVDFSRVFEMSLKKRKKRKHHNLENIWTCVFAPYTKIERCWWKGYVTTMLQYFGFIFGNVQQRLKSFAEKLAFLEQSHCNIPELFAFTSNVKWRVSKWKRGEKNSFPPTGFSRFEIFLRLKFVTKLANFSTISQIRIYFRYCVEILFPGKIFYDNFNSNLICIVSFVC